MANTANPVSSEPLRWSRTMLAVASLSAAGALLIAAGAAELPDLDQPVAAMSGAFGSWTYLVVGVFAFFETAAFVGLAVPGETAVLAGGMVAHRGDVELVPLFAVVWLAATAGDTTSFLVGRRAGRGFLTSHGAALRPAPSAPRRAGGRFVGLARAVTPFLAGTAAMRARRFVALSLTGALAWASLPTALGYAFSDSVATAGDAVTRFVLAGVLLVVALLVVRRWMRSRAGTRDHGATGVADLDRRVPPTPLGGGRARAVRGLDLRQTPAVLRGHDRRARRGVR